MSQRTSGRGPREALEHNLGLLGTAFGFITAVVGFISIVREEASLIFSILLVAGVAVLWGSLFYIRFKKSTIGERFGQPREVPAYPDQARLSALVGIFIVPVLIIGFFVWRFDVLHPSVGANPVSDNVIILVANFDGPDQTYGVTETIISRLRDATQEYDDVQVQALNETITTQQGSSVARARGEERGASIVLWGWYRVPRDSALVTVHFEVLKSPRFLSLRQDERSQTLAVAELESFQIQTRLSNEMRYLTLLTLGLARYEVEDYDGAIDRFTGALDQPDVPEDMVDPAGIYFYRGTAYYIKGEYDRAIADFDRALDLNPELVEAYNNRGNAYAERGEYDRSIADFDRALDLNPELVEAYNNRGNAYAEKGELDSAIADFDRALELDLELALAYSNRGATYIKIGEYDRAIADFDRAIELNPEMANAYLHRGYAYYKKGEYDLAITNYDRTIELNPSDFFAYRNRGYSYHQKGDTNRAAVDLERAREIQAALQDRLQPEH